MRASDITILDVRELSDITDYFVICTGDTRRQLRAIAARLTDELGRCVPGKAHSEGEEDSSWILIDLGEVVAHLFLPDARGYYDLELLWGDAPRVAWDPE